MKASHTLASILIILTAVLFSREAMCTEIMPPPDSPLLEAVKKGDPAEVKLILEARGPAGVDIEEKGNYGNTPLALAARNGNLEIVRLLVEHGAAVDGKGGGDARTPLMEACAYGHVETAQYLISKGAYVNARRKGLTPLLVASDHFSAQFGPVGDKKKTVSLLLENGAEVNVQDESWLKSGMTPLMFAVAQGDAAMVQAILSKGAKSETTNRNGDTALDLAKKSKLEYITQLLESGASAPGGSLQEAKASSEALVEMIRQGRLEKVRSLVSKGADVNGRTKNGSTPLMYAADANKPEIAKFLISKGADVNAKNGTNDTALIFASLKGNAKVARVLLQSKADPNIKNIGGGDALVYAVLNKRVEAVNLLLNSGARIDETYNSGKTALILAIEQDAPRIANILIEKGADANAQDEDGKTALMYACGKEDSGTVKALLDKGARIDTKTKNGDTALETAIASRNVAAVRLLIEKGVDFKSTGALSSAVIVGSIELVRLFKLKGADINERCAGGRTPLMYAASRETCMVKYLIAQGADVNARDSEERTALMYAVDSSTDSRPQIIKLLLAKNADCNAANDRGETALIMAAKQGDAETVKALLEKGSDAAAQDKGGKTAWAYAFEGGNTAITALLEKKGSPKSYVGVTWEGNISNQKEELIEVVSNKEDWTVLWKRAFDKPAPDVDFERYAVACVFLGRSASWHYSIEFGMPHVHGSRLVIPYSLIEVQLRLSGPYRASGQYRMTVYEKRQGLEMVIEDAMDEYRKEK